MEFGQRKIFPLQMYFSFIICKSKRFSALTKLDILCSLRIASSSPRVFCPGFLCCGRDPGIHLAVSLRHAGSLAFPDMFPVDVSSAVGKFKGNSRPERKWPKFGEANNNRFPKN
jgi:hypothetical protein